MTDARHEDAFPASGRLAGVDYGEKRIGVALSDAGQRLATPWETRDRRTEGEDAAFFRQLVEDEQVVGFVVGLPVHSSGEESAKSREARAFGRWLAEKTERPVRFYDERYTSAMADRYMEEGRLTKKARKQRRDMVAAQIILAAYLESSGDAEHHGGLDDDG